MAGKLPEGAEVAGFISWLNVEDAGSNARRQARLPGHRPRKGLGPSQHRSHLRSRRLSTTPASFGCFRQTINALHAAWSESKAWPLFSAGSSGKEREAALLSRVMLHRSVRLGLYEAMTFGSSVLIDHATAQTERREALELQVVQLEIRWKAMGGEILPAEFATAYLARVPARSTMERQRKILVPNLAIPKFSHYVPRRRLHLTPSTPPKTPVKLFWLSPHRPGVRRRSR